jgi:hypothetical protein
MASLFNTLRSELMGSGYAMRSKQARSWFQEKLREMNGRINRKSLLNDEALKVRSNALWGHMFMFVYDPKLKDTLPYYDRFPLVLALQPAEGGFLGLNLHYLRPDYRAIFLDKLMATMPAGTSNLDERSKLRLRYSLLASARKFREFGPCIKHYLYDHVRSRISQVYAPDWEIAIFLPTEHFAKANKTKVWKESQKQYMKS